MLFTVNIPSDLPLLALLNDKQNIRILEHIQNNSNHSLREIKRTTKLSHEQARYRIQALRKAGVIKISEKGGGRRPNTYRITRNKLVEALLKKTTA